MKYNKRFLSIITLLLAILIIVLLGTMYETDDEGLYKITFHHLDNPQNYYLLHHAFTKYIYYALYSINASLPWYDIIIYPVFLLTIFNLQKIFNEEVLPLDDEKPGPLVLTVLFTAALFYWNLISFNYLRLTLLLAGSSTYLLVKYLLTQNKERISTIYQIVLLFFAANTRIEGAMFAALLAAPVPLMLYSKWQIKKVIVSCIVIPVVFAPVVIADYIRDSSPVYKVHAEREKYIYNMFEGLYINYSAQINTGLDSLRKEAVDRFFIADIKGVPFSFLKKLFDRDVLSLTNLLDYKRNVGKSAAVLVLLFTKATFAFVLIILSYFAVSHKRIPFIAIAYVIATMLLLMVIGWIFKPEVRLLEPCGGLVLLFTLTLLARDLKDNTPISDKALLILSAGLILFTISAQRNNYLFIKDDANERQQFVDEIKKNLPGKDVYINAYYFHYALTNPFKEFPVNNEVNLVTIDIPYINIPAQTGKLCPADDYEGFLKCWQRNPNAVLISDDDFASFMNRYSQMLYGLPMNFKKTPIQPAINGNNQFYYYYFLQ